MVSVDGKDKERFKRVWFSFAGINCVWMTRVNELSEGAAGDEMESWTSR